MSSSGQPTSGTDNGQSQGPLLDRITLKGGQEIKVNDHVYCSPPWAVRDGTPYSVARVMEFLRPEGKHGEDANQFHFTRVRLAWYYRPSDVNDRAVNDSRLLLAAIYSEVTDVNHIRAKCHVVHRDKISDLSGWKKRPDRFYFNRLFDPYIKREFEIIPSTDARNLPENVRENLIAKYEYIVAEKEAIPDLTDSVRNCQSCNEWCSANESVPCDRCKNYFHMHCVNPPLSAKPSRGYGWTCAPCSKEHEEAVTTQQQPRHTTPSPVKPKSNAPAARGRGRPRKDRTQAEKEENVVIKHFRLWPFRYFGQLTEAHDTLDDDDLIFPRAPVRQGPKFQATLPEPNAMLLDEERGGDNTVEVLSAINILTDAEVTEMDGYKRQLTDDPKVKSSVDWLTEVIRRFSEAALAARSLSTVNMKSIMRNELWKPHPTRYTDKEWTKEEIALFEDGIQMHGAELRAVQEEIRTKTVYEVVRFYTHWKSGKIAEANQILRQDGAPPSPQFPTYAENGNQKVGLPDDQASYYEHAPRQATSCGACRTRESAVWFKAPKGLATSYLCESCGTNWRKYADLNVRPLREESVPSMKGRLDRDKREGSPLNGPLSKRTSGSVHSTPPPMTSTPHLKCLACMRNGPVGKVLQCRKCEFRVHAGSVGVAPSATAVESWLCDICQNQEVMEASVTPECLLCPKLRPRPNPLSPGPLPDSYLRACKPTEGQGWAHLICAVFIPELAFTDCNNLKVVEGVSALSSHRWTTRCSLCYKTDGAVQRCNDCNREFHVSCAWNHGHKFGFEIQPVKSSRRDSTITINFKGETGCMNAIISCREHDHNRRDIYDICETNEAGETALQVFCRAYKQVAVDTAHALLRKAKRMDQIINLKSDVLAAAGPDCECYRCRTQFSPAFYPHASQWLCHRCYIEHEYIADPNGMDVDPPIRTNGVNGINGTLVAASG